MVQWVENHIRIIFLVILGVFILGFLSFFSFYQDFGRNQAAQRLQEDALVIARPLWRYEESPVAYLELSARSNNYRSVLIVDDADNVFAHIMGPEQSRLDKLLADAGLLPITHLEAIVKYRGKIIGKIQAEWENRAVYVYFYILVCLILLFIGVWFFLNLYIAKKTLKDKVAERTADLKESQDQLQAILNNAEAVIYLKDVKGRYITVNNRFEQLFNVDRIAVAGLKDHDIFPAHIADIYHKNDQKILETKSALHFEETAPDQFGGERNYISVKFPLKKSNGTLYALCGISTDITKMKQAEKELRHLRNYLSNIINSMPSTLIGVDDEGLITLWNNQAEQVTGYIPQKAVGRSLETVYPQLSEGMDQVRRAIDTRTEQQSKKQARRQDDVTVYEDITIYPLIANGVEGAVIRIDDITDQVQLEEMMVQSEKMLSVGGLAAGMAHEINNPLAGMIQTASVMRMRLEDMDMPANRQAAEQIGVSVDHIRDYMEKRGIFRMVDAINESGSRVAEIVDNMLSFARKSDAVFSSYQPEQLVDKILELAATDYDLKKQYDFKTIKIIKEYEENLPMLPCEGAKIQQVLLNILRNGAQAMQSSRQKDSYEPCFIIRLSIEKEPGMLRIEIQDNGPGIDKATQKRIFEPFFTTKQPGIGTGLGLSVSYFIVTENHGGTMDVASAPGKGTTFYIRLPLAPDKGGEHG